MLMRADSFRELDRLTQGLVDALLEWAHRGPRSAVVEDVTAQAEPAESGLPQRFEAPVEQRVGRRRHAPAASSPG